MMGIDVNRTISFTFLIAGCSPASPACSTRSSSTNVQFDTGFRLGLFAFTAAVLGGIGNLPGAVLGAICIGLIEQFNDGLTWYTPGTDWTARLIFAILILILVFRPRASSASERRRAAEPKPARARLWHRRRATVERAVVAWPAELGLSRERFHACARWQQRAGKVALGGVLAFLISIFVKVLEHSFGARPPLDPHLRRVGLHRVRRRRAARRSRVECGSDAADAARPTWCGSDRRAGRAHRRPRHVERAQRRAHLGRPADCACRAALARNRPPQHRHPAPPEAHADRQEGRSARGARACDLLPVLLRAHVHDPRLRILPGRHDGGEHARVHHDGRRPEHRRRLRGPARPRLRRLLRRRAPTRPRGSRHSSSPAPSARRPASTRPTVRSRLCRASTSTSAGSE